MAAIGKPSRLGQVPGIGRFAGLSPQSEEYKRILEAHRVSESRARRDARRLVFKLRHLPQTWDRNGVRLPSGREVGKDETILRVWAKKYGIKPEHTELFVQIVTRTIDKDLEVRP